MEKVETLSQLTANRVYHQSEYGYSDAEKTQTSIDPHNYILQIPSQFQGNSSVTSRKANAANLVKKNVADDAKSGVPPTAPPLVLLRNIEEKERTLLYKKADTPGNGEPETPLNTRNATDTCYQNEYQNARRRDEKSLSVPSDKSTDDSGFASSDNELAKITTAETRSPNVINTVQCSSVKHRTTLLERLTNSRPGRSAAFEKDDEGNKGIVLNLKKEFEAKCNVAEKNKQRKKCSSQGDSNNNEDARSLPSSPVNEHTRNRNYPKPSSAASTEDLSVKKLVGKYEVAKSNKDRMKCDKRQPPIPPRKSSLDINLPQSRFGMKHASNVFTQYNRSHRGVAPIVKSFLSTPNEIRSTVTKAANMLQQTKTHPLSKLNFCKQRNNPPVYNTM